MTSKDSKSSIIVSVLSLASSRKFSYVNFIISSSFSGFFASLFLTFISSFSNSSKKFPDSKTSSNLLFISSNFCSKSCLKKLIASSFSLLLISVTIY